VCRPGLRRLVLLADAGVIADAEACRSFWKAEAVDGVTRGSQGNGIASEAVVSLVPEIRFLTVGGRRVAYEVAGEGPLLLCPAWWVSHLELDRGNQAFAQFWEAIGDGYCLVRYDRLGVGVSDRDLRDEDLTVDEEVEVIGALLDELGAERVGLFGGSSGGCAAIAFAARFPERVERLMLYGSYAEGPSITPPAVRRRSSRPSARTGASDRGCCRTSSSARSAAKSKNGSRGFSGWPPAPRRRPGCWSRCIATTFATSCRW
jgi:pimeloyl-ACP methyl ester carboxylesterase